MPALLSAVSRVFVHHGSMAQVPVGENQEKSSRVLCLFISSKDESSAACDGVLCLEMYPRLGSFDRNAVS